MATASETTAPDGVIGPTARQTAGAGQGDLAVGRWDPGAEEPSKSDRYLARRLAAASADFKSVACTTFLLGAAVAGGAWLAVGILAEHWLVPGGLSPPIRWAWLGIALVAFIAAAVRWLVPLVRYRVNLVYAARAIEREHPELHNDLVNTVLVKAHRESNPEKVVRSLERRTAKQLAEVPVEAVIDRTVPLRLAWVLAALVGLAGLYELAAPKSLLVTAARLLAPWVGWAAPSRVRIEVPRLAWRMPAEQGQAADALDRRSLAIEAGSTSLVRGRQLVVAADIRGLRRGERPEVVVAPLRADGSVDPTVPAWKAELTRAQAAAGTDRSFVTALPDATRGLDQSVEITITAGDARTTPVRVAVVDSPTLLVREIRYLFPAYTGRPPETVAWQGDIRALEGTEVTVVAESNHPLEDAWIDFEGDGGRDLKFSKSAADHARVTKTFQLRLKADGTGPEHASYRLLFQPRSPGAGGREQVITDPLEHRIEVLADVAPEVAIDAPRESPLRVPPAAPVTVRVQAHDPDFALARVAIETRLQGAAAGPEITVLEKEHGGVFRGAAQLVPERLGAGPGAVLEYRAVAIDNRPKQPNVSHSPWQALKIDASAPPRQSEPPPSGRQPAEGDPSQGQAGEQGGGTRDGKDGPQGAQQPDQPGANDRQDNPRGPGSKREQNQAQDQEQERQSREQQAGKDKQQGKQDGQAEGAQGGDRQQQPAEAKQAGNQQGQGQNQGQGAQQGQGVGAQGERQGGAEQQAGKQRGGQSDREQEGRQQGGQPQSGQQRGKNEGKNEKQSGGAGDKAVAADGTNDGEALERILEHRREQGGEQRANARQGDKEDGRSRQGEGEQQGEGENQRTQQREGESAKQAAGEHDHAPCNDADGKPCGKDGCPTCKGQGKGGQAGGGQPGSDASGGKQKNGPGAAADEGGGESGGKDQGGAEGPGRQGSGKDGLGKEEGGDQTADGAGAASGDDKQAAGSQRKQGQQVRDQGEGQQPGSQAGAGKKRADAGDEAAPQPGEPGSGTGQAGSGGWAGGAAPRRPDDAAVPDGPPPSRETEWGEQDLAHARNAASLALEHLRKAVESGDTTVLDRLGWTRDQARAFLERWEKMRRLAESADPIERGTFDRTMRSLGLRPDGVKSSRDVPADARGGQAEGRRSRPPADYQEQVKAYTQGTSGE